MKLRLIAKIALTKERIVNFEEWEDRVLELDPTAIFMNDGYNEDPNIESDRCAMRPGTSFMIGRWYGAHGYGEVYDYEPGDVGYRAVKKQPVQLEVSFKLGEYRLTLRPDKANDKDRFSIWRLYKNDKYSGEVTIYYVADVKYPSIYSIWVEEIQQGLGSKIIKILVNYYLGLTSDPLGNTNSAAQRMWESLSAKKIKYNSPLGYYYQLAKDPKFNKKNPEPKKKEEPKKEENPRKKESNPNYGHGPHGGG